MLRDLEEHLRVNRLPFVIVALILAIVIGAALWLLFGKGPRLARLLAQVEHFIKEGSWEEALQIAERCQAMSLSPTWQTKVNRAQGEVLRVAGDSLFQQKRYEDGLGYYLKAVPLLGLEEEAVRRRAQSAMMVEARAIFAGLTGRELAANDQSTSRLQELLTRALIIQDRFPEAYFWQALLQIKMGHVEQAFPLLSSVHEICEKQVIDPLFYQGALLYGQGKHGEALRVLSEANRIDPRCPMVTWLMGRSMVASNGDAAMAVRVLQRALGSQGLGLWIDSPHRLWVEAFPEGKSWIRKLAEQHAYTCPIFGADLKVLIRLGELALAQAQYRQRHYSEAAELFKKLLGESAPSLPVLRGLGLSLSRLERYDEAFKHLRAALEMSPDDPVLTGHLAVCGACGRTRSDEDKPKNIAWAIRQFARFNILHDEEWALLQLKVHTEARELGMEIASEDQVRLCDALTSVHCTSRDAALAYDRFAETCPDRAQPAHAWHYCQAAWEHQVEGDSDARLFELAFRENVLAERFFQQMGWDLTEVEILYLKRHAVRQPGTFPSIPEENYPQKASTLLFTRSEEMEQQGEWEEAISLTSTLLRLSPTSTVAHDRLACLHFRQGDRSQALDLLAQLQKLKPEDPVPFVRRGLIEHLEQNRNGCFEQLERAMALSNGSQKAEIAFLAGRIALKDHLDAGNSSGDAERYLRICLEANPAHLEGLCMLAALWGLEGKKDELSTIIPQMGRSEVLDSRYHYLSAVCFLAVSDYPRALELADRAALDDHLAVECHYLKGWAFLHLGRIDEAIASFQITARSESPSADHARGLLGKLGLEKGTYLDVAKWWSLMDPDRRKEWSVDEPLRQSVYLTALSALQKGRYEQAADRFREAGQLGLREAVLGSLIRLAYFKAGQQLFYQTTGPNGHRS